ncbi:MAG TPA: cell division protein ZapB [Vicinamibacterales bacterium]|nr:cell division protein ZapB [Vicinamibacterales bacterium]
MARTGAAADLQPIDRLEDKIRQLVEMIDVLRAERARAADEVARLERELDAARSAIADASGATTEVTSLREERELIRNRVVQMIAQIDKLNL